MTAQVDVRSIPPGHWPREERLALERARAPDDDGSGECGAAAALRPATLASYIQTYGQFLDFATRTGGLGEAGAPGSLVTPARVAAWRRETRARGLAPTARRQMLRNLSAMLRLLAPDRDRSFITRPGNRPLRRAIPGGPKPFTVHDVDEAMPHLRRLHRQGLAAADGPERWRALRDAALLAVLLTRAPRLRSLVAMTLDRHLELRSDGTWHLRFPGEHTKTGRRLDYPLDAAASAMLTDYLEQARSRFPGAGRTGQLWMGMRGPMTREGVQGIAERRTLAWFDKAHGPHAFRKWLRASAARRAPELAMDAADIMGHSAEVSVQHYAEASGLHAGLRQGDRLAERRARQAGRAERAFAAEIERWEEGG
ncbi:tyrosine-type recombinase/integrase [Roseicella frigidaeris]|uniref:Tyr recombinase domain-containing protein n=1 Tax=Roseicella frigidaeris TaxID=2230885 RepID=A0A327LWL2_9PROT|nr:site-specific integrase [Roseicella frigidaeris]RAI54584.1 hypothetical protein DOO78_25990 [Roseicella frigidaeris]